MKRWPWMLLLAVMLSGSALAQPAPLTTQQADQVRRLTAAIVFMFPAGEIFADQKQHDPGWPFDKHLAAVTKAQLECARARMTVTAFQTVVTAHVRKYVRDYPGRIEADIKLLDSPGVRRTRASIERGYNQRSPDGTLNRAAFDIPITAEEQREQMALSFGQNNGPLRVLLGLPENVTQANAHGAALGKPFILDSFRSAMDACGIPHK